MRQSEAEIFQFHLKNNLRLKLTCKLNKYTLPLLCLIALNISQNKILSYARKSSFSQFKINLTHWLITIVMHFMEGYMYNAFYGRI